MKVFSIAAGVALVLVGLTQSGLAQARPTTVTGHVMDIACATKDVSKGAAVIADHDKKCLLMASCVKSRSLCRTCRPSIGSPARWPAPIGPTT